MPVPKYSIVATDLDGTFVAPVTGSTGDKLEAPTDANRKLFQSLAAKGVPIVLISGRAYHATALVNDMLDIDAYILSFHGATIFGPKCGAAERPLLKAWPLPQDVCETSLAVAERSDSMALLYTADGILSVGTAPDDMKVPRWRNGEGPATGSGDTIGEWWVKAGEFPVPVVGSPCFEALSEDHKRIALAGMHTVASRFFGSFEAARLYLKESGVAVFKAIVVTQPGEACVQRTEELRERIPPSSGHIIGPIDFFTEIINPQCNKAVALKWLTEHVFGTTIKSVIAFGDGINDIEMLSQAGLGIAMANAGQQVKDVADITSTWSNSESAVARELEVVIGCGELAGATEGSSPLAVL